MFWTLHWGSQLLVYLSHSADKTQIHGLRYQKCESFSSSLPQNKSSSFSSFPSLPFRRTTNQDGRCSNLLTSEQFVPGTYRIRFDTAAYFTSIGNHEPFYPYVEVHSCTVLILNNAHSLLYVIDCIQFKGCDSTLSHSTAPQSFLLHHLQRKLASSLHFGNFSP